MRWRKQDGTSLVEVLAALVIIGPFTSIIGIMKYQQQYGLSNHEASGYVIARRGLGIDAEKVPDPLVKRFVRKKEGFYQLSNWKQWSGAPG